MVIHRSDLSPMVKKKVQERKLDDHPPLEKDRKVGDYNFLGQWGVGEESVTDIYISSLINVCCSWQADIRTMFAVATLSIKCGKLFF